MFAIYRRELGSYFISPIGYIFLAVFYAFSALFFHSGTLSSGYANVSSMFFSMFFILLVIIPILTMRMFSEDKKSKTEQLLLTSPVSLLSIVLGKFLAAMTIFAMGVAIMVVYVVVLSAFATVAWAMVWGNVVAMLLLGMVFISVGMMVSCLTENQMIAAVGAFAVVLALVLIDAVAAAVPIAFIADILYSLSVLSRYSMFSSGIFSISSIVYFLSIALIFNFLTVRILEKRRWS